MASLPPLAFWLAVLGAPLLVVVINSGARFAARLPQSGAADIILALIIFDVVVVIQNKEFEQHIQSAAFRPSIIAIYTIMIVVGMGFWALAVFVAEKKISEYQEYKKISSCNTSGCTLKGSQQIKPPRILVLISLFIALLQLGCSVGPFVSGWQG
jgi:hypothetical protein